MKLEDILSQVKEVEEQKLKQESTGYTIDPRILKLKKGGTYRGRLLPLGEKGRDTFSSYQEVGFTSRATGAYTYVGRSPKNAGIESKNDVLYNTQFNEYNKVKDSGNKELIRQACSLIPQRKQMINFYLEDVKGDDDAKDKIGKVVVLRYPAQINNKTKEPTSEIYKIISEGVLGDKVSKIGTRAFDLTSKGRSLEIKVTSKGEGTNAWPSYSAVFDDAEDLGLTPKQIPEIYSSVHDLSEFVPEVKSDSEIKKILDEHWFVKNATQEDELDESEKPDDDTEESSDIDDLLDGIN